MTRNTFLSTTVCLGSSVRMNKYQQIFELRFPQALGLTFAGRVPIAPLCLVTEYYDAKTPWGLGAVRDWWLAKSD